jgi:hypothetical protein
MLIAGPHAKVRIRPRRRAAAALPALGFALFAAAAVAVLAVYGSTAAALITALLVNAAATPVAHAAGLRRRTPPRAE